jgi:hypothetical protein
MIILDWVGLGCVALYCVVLCGMVCLYFVCVMLEICTEPSLANMHDIHRNNIVPQHAFTC